MAIRATEWAVAALMIGAAWYASSAKNKYTVPKQSGGYSTVAALSKRVEQVAQMPGFSAFALAVATNESKGNNLAVNDSTSEAKAACSLYEANADSRFKDNPYPASRWCFGSGGYYGFLPAVAMSSKPFRNLDPYIIFDPAASTALLADYVRRVVSGYWSKLPSSCRNWLTIRRFMASNKVGLDCNETNYDRSAVVRERFARDLKKRGLSPSLMYKPVVIGKWPGAWELYMALQQLEGLPAPMEGTELPDYPGTPIPLEGDE